MMATDEFKQCAERLKAVADPERLRILHCLFAGPKNVSQISAELEEEIVNVSHHLAVLRRAKVLQATRRGRFIEYALHPEVAKSASKSGPKKIEFGCCRIDLTDIS
jgi:DNA-binding transcriptional ArsR family regulator